MKRLLAQIGLTYLSVLAVVFYLGKFSAFIILSIALLLFIVFLAVKKCRTTIYLPVMACVALIACVVNILYTTCAYNKTVETYNGYSGKVVAKLEEEPYKNYDMYYYKFKCIKADSQNCNFRFIAYSKDLLDIDALSTIETQVELSKTENKSYIAKRYFLTGSFGYGAAQIKEISPPQKGYRYFAIKLRQKIRETLETYLSKDAFCLSSALLLGDKYALSNELRQQFTQAGVSHLIVVSGMHFSILVSLFIILTKIKGLRRFKNFILALAVLFIFIYMGVTGFVPSVMRSGIMLLVCTVGMMIVDDPYPPNSLGLAAIILTCYRPYLAGDMSLILSFATTFSIITLAPILTDKFSKRIISDKPIPKNDKKIKKKLIAYSRKIANFLLAMLSVNISAYVVSLPLSILFFGAAPTLSVIVSIVLYFPIQFLLILSFIIAVIGFIPFTSFLIVFLSSVANMLTDLSLAIVNFFADLPFSYLHVTFNFVYLFILLSAILLLWMFISKDKLRLKVISLCMALMLLVGYLSAVYLESNVSTVNVYNVDNGLAVMYKSPDTNALLTLDCNRKNTFETIGNLENKVTKFELVSCVNNTQDSFDGLNSLTKAFAINSVLLYDNKRTVYLPDTVDTCIVPQSYQKVALSDKESVTYYLAGDKYITYLDAKTCSLLVLPNGVDVENIPPEYRSASIIVFSKYPQNFELLSCDTLIISEKEESAYFDMKLVHSISDRILLTADGDIEVVMEV